MYKRKKLLVLALLLWISSCVEPYEVDIENTLEVLTIDATLTDDDVDQIISIAKTVNSKGNVFSAPLTNLKVEIQVNGKERIQLTDRKNGKYALPVLFRIKAGNTYKLLFQKEDGTKYESAEERLNSLPEIDKIYDEFEPKGERVGIIENPANYVYADFQDSANEQNNYLWSWRLWERQYVCRTIEYDYYCDKECWEIFHNETLNAFSDIYSNGKPVIGTLAAIIPYYSATGALLEIKLQSVSYEAFKYLNLLTEQVEKSGTLVDTPPGLIIGNVKNINAPNERIAGFFMVTSSRTVRYWLNRENAKGKAQPIGVLRRKNNPDPRPNVPVFDCVSGPNRTPTKPKGWVD